MQITEPPSLSDVTSMFPSFDLTTLAAKDVVTITASATVIIIFTVFMIDSLFFIVRTNNCPRLVNYKVAFAESSPFAF